jgi:hypothetical protein
MKFSTSKTIIRLKIFNEIKEMKKKEYLNRLACKFIGEYHTSMQSYPVSIRVRSSWAPKEYGESVGTTNSLL